VAFRSQINVAAPEDKGRPTLRSLHPAWGVLSDKVAELSRREDDITRRMQAIIADQAKRNAIILTSPGVETIVPPKPKKPLAARVRDMLGDLAPTAEPEATPAIKPETKVIQTRIGDQELADLGTELQNIRAAVEILHPSLAAARVEGSKLLCAARMPEYTAVAARVCDALVSLGNAVIAHKRLTQEMTDDGADWSGFKPVDVNALALTLGDPQNRESRWHRVLAGAAEGGHFDLAYIPADWTPAPTPVTEAARPGRGNRT
jgi:hypothetical protein